MLEKFQVKNLLIDLLHFNKVREHHGNTTGSREEGYLKKIEIARPQPDHAPFFLFIAEV